MVSLLMCVAVPVRLPHEGATREHWDRHRSPFLRPYGGGNGACPDVHGACPDVHVLLFGARRHEGNF